MRRKIIKKLDRVLQVSDDALKYGDLINHLQPCGNDLILLTLKGHLIIENLIEVNLVRLLNIENLPKGNGRLGFKHKLELVKSVVVAREPGPNADMFCVIDELNELRNQIAHKLKNHVEVEKDVRLFIVKNRRLLEMSLDSDKSLPEQLSICIRKLAGFLLKVRIHFFKLEEQEDD
jgi:hypothetical protein